MQNRQAELVRGDTGEGNGTTFDLTGRLVLCEGGNRLGVVPPVDVGDPGQRTQDHEARIVGRLALDHTGHVAPELKERLSKLIRLF